MIDTTKIRRFQCDRCGFTDEASSNDPRVNPLGLLRKWGKILAVQVPTSDDAVYDREGPVAVLSRPLIEQHTDAVNVPKYGNDLCPGCINSLKQWWKQ